jgi:aryl-phospho-beta-D-glucosidase BglC (GH1 family)
MNGGALSSSADLGVIPSSWTVQGAGNFAGVMTDIVWRNSNGDVNVWLMNGSTISSSADLGVIPTAWTVSSVGQAVTATATPTPVALAVSVMGHQLINGSGNVIQLRGVNLSGMEFTAIQGWDPSDPTGGQMGQALGPNWTALNSWKPNAVRIPLNEASWLGLTCTDINGFSRNTDPGANYRQTLANLVQAANNAGLYVILDLHWAAPGNVCPVQQGQMADADHSLNFWTSIANTYKNNPAVLFELFNEPFFDNDFEGNAWTYMTFGAGGSFTGIQESGNGDPLWWEDVQTNWNIASYQAIITTIRNTGATNVLLVGTMHYSQDFSDWLADMPTDPLNQMAATWHPYPNYGTTWGTPAYTQPNYAPQVFTEVQNILAAGIPVVVTETGDQNSAGTGIGTGCALPANYSLCAPFLTTMIQFVDQYGISMLGWTWDVWSYSSNVLIRDDDGTPTDGYGQVFKSWLVNHQ